MHTIKELFDLTGKTALITGGSRGLGLQLAEALGEQGAKLVISSRKQHELDEAIENLKQRGIDAIAIAADLGQEQAPQILAAASLKHLGHVDILINNAGATWGAPAEDHPLEAWDKVMNLDRFDLRQG
jgi:gluconate 5-dehydrogenase